MKLKIKKWIHPKNKDFRLYINGIGCYNKIFVRPLHPIDYKHYEIVFKYYINDDEKESICRDIENYVVTRNNREAREVLDFTDFLKIAV